MKKIVLTLSCLLLLLASLPIAAEEAFWVPRKEPLAERNWTAYVPANKELAKQAILIHALLPGEPVEVRQVLGAMYKEVESLKILGRKPVEWRDGEGTLVSFSGKQKDRNIVGRAVIAPSEDGTEVVLLVRHPAADSRIMQSFESLRVRVPEFLSLKSRPLGG